MAGFPTHAPKSREYPEPHVSPGSPASPVSEGQVLDGETDKLLKALALRNACTDGNKPEDKLWQLARDLKAVDKHRGRKLSNRERILTFNEWLRQSRLFLDPAKSHDDYFAALLAQLAKVRVPTGEGAITVGLEMVAEQSDSDWPFI